MERIRKLGIVKISKELYEDKYKSIVCKLFLEFQPLNITFELYPEPIYRVIGTSDSFEEVKEGFNIPVYDVLFRMNENKDYTITFNKIYGKVKSN